MPAKSQTLPFIIYFQRSHLLLKNVSRSSPHVNGANKINQHSVNRLNSTSHTSSIQQTQVASDYHGGQHRCRTFLPLCKVLVDDIRLQDAPPVSYKIYESSFSPDLPPVAIHFSKVSRLFLRPAFVYNSAACRIVLSLHPASIQKIENPSSLHTYSKSQKN